jgi:hypothetical protein
MESMEALLIDAWYKTEVYHKPFPSWSSQRHLCSVDFSLRLF